MPHPTRRRLLQASGLVVPGALAGCLGLPSRSTTETPTGTDTSPSDRSSETTDDGASLTEWKRSTDCEGEYDGMHDSVIRVKAVSDGHGDGYAPIHFSNLSPAEQDILRVVTEEGGYGTCDASDAFDRFVDRVQDRRQRQSEDGVYLERETTYYRLYVEKLDQVYAY